MSAVFSPGCDTSSVIVSPISQAFNGDDDMPSMVVAVGHAVMVIKVSSGAGWLILIHSIPLPMESEWLTFLLKMNQNLSQRPRRAY